MPFVVPDFNLDCDFYTGPWLTKIFRFRVKGNLAWGRRVQNPQLTGSFIPGGNVSVTMTLLLPAGTDVRDASQSGSPELEIVEVPATSGRWYGVATVDDVGKGFANEHRAAVLTKIFQQLDPVQFAGLLWPTPMP